jgi:Family of unknown function (DUF6982)
LRGLSIDVAQSLLIAERAPQDPEPLVRIAEPTEVAELGSDRRVHRRHSSDELTWLRAARLKYGPIVDILDLSVGGALFETDTALRPGSHAVLEIVGDANETLVPFQLLRCHVSSLKGRLRYRSACEFKRPFHSIGGGVLQIEESLERLKLDRALKKIVDRHTSEDDAQATIDALKALCAEAARRGRDPLARTLQGLLTEVLPLLHKGERARFQAASVEAFLRKTLPFLTIKLQPSKPLIHSGSHESIYFVLGSHSSAEALTVEFPSGLVLEPWQFGLLKSGAAVITLLRRWRFEVSEPEPTPLPAPSKVQSVSTVPFGWQRIIARYLDGTVDKGYTQDFNSSRQTLHLRSSFNGDSEDQKVIPLSRLKAVFFVRDFAGDAGHAEKKAFSGRVPGRRIEVTFSDNEVILGSTLSYRPQNEGHGFFIKPVDPESNNQRIFVVMNAVRHVRFP